MKLARQDCPPEPFDFAQDKLREGSRAELLRYVQNDAPAKLHRTGRNDHTLRVR